MSVSAPAGPAAGGEPGTALVTLGMNLSTSNCLLSTFTPASINTQRFHTYQPHVSCYLLSLLCSHSSLLSEWLGTSVPTELCHSYIEQIKLSSAIVTLSQTNCSVYETVCRLSSLFLCLVPIFGMLYYLRLP